MSEQQSTFQIVYSSVTL